MNKLIVVVFIALIALVGCTTTEVKEGVVTPMNTASEMAASFYNSRFRNFNYPKIMLKAKNVNGVLTFVSNTSEMKLPHVYFSENELSSFVNSMDTLCKTKNGEFTYTTFEKFSEKYGTCEDKDSLPIFVLEIHVDDLMVYEKTGDLSTTDWLSFLLSNGRDDLKQVKKFKQDEIIRKQKEIQLNKTKVAGIGTGICKDISYSEYLFGFIDNRDNSKLKILVHKHIIKSSSGRSSQDVQNYYIWDDQNNWYVCDAP